MFGLSLALQENVFKFKSILWLGLASAAITNAFAGTAPIAAANASASTTDQTSQTGQSSQIGQAPYLHNQHNRDAFATPVPALTAAELRVFNFGNRLFNTNWVVAPASAAGFDGLGPTFNRVSCSGCHLRDGRGRAPLDSETELLSSLIRISVATDSTKQTAVVDKLGVLPVPGYGTQINDHAIPGVQPEATVNVSWQTIDGKFADGTAYQLRKPVVRLSDANFGPLPKNLLTSFRVAPAVFGLGLLEAIDEQVIRVAADPNDKNQDGISGRANLVWSDQLQKHALGRFGWKANVATLIDQNAGAAVGDIGITSRLHTQQNCEPEQAQCKKAINGGEPELSDVFLDKLNAYVQMLGVPAARPMTVNAKIGQQRFTEFGCASCHTPQMQTAKSAPFSFLQAQTINAYTDLLLHDMGAGLADGRPDFLADGQEWRTAPLWGIALVPTVNEHSFYLHDGRARNLTEAILWHGGEAEAAKEKFRKAKQDDREALLEFLQIL